MKAHDELSMAAVIDLDAMQCCAGNGGGAPNRALRASLLAALGLHRVPDGLAHALVQDAGRSGHANAAHALGSALEIRMQAKPLDYMRTNALMLLGVQGAGKSTVAAKIAVQAYLMGRDVRIVAFDPHATPLKRPASELGITIVHGPSAQLMAKAVADAHARNTFVIIDTQGFNPRNAKARAAFSALGQIGHVQSIAVVSALYDAAEIEDIVGALNAQRLIVTGLDLVRRAGALTIAATQPIPLAHVARSPFAGDGLEPITPLALAQIILGVRADRR